MRFPVSIPSVCLAAALALAGAHAAQAGEHAGGQGSDVLRAVVADLCPRSDLGADAVQAALPGSWVLEALRQPEGPAPRRILIRAVLPGEDVLTLERRQAGGVLRQFRASLALYDGAAAVPHLLAIADGGCEIRSGRLLRAEGPVWRYLDQLDGDLQTVRWSEVVQAPWPEGRDPGGVRVGLVDSGLAYDLPQFRDRLARDAAGVPLGYDFWDLDPFPYDGDTSRGVFLPIRHGTAVASVLAREAPEAALVPYRYPRPDLAWMGDLVARAARDGVRILAMPLGSREAADWAAFADALAGTDMLAIVSAGNDGRDIDADPIYPAGLDLANIITVTSSDGFGRLAEGSNWGGRSVDLMVPAEAVPVMDFRGAAGRASGSSYAVPRLAALAARILAEEPDLSAEDLKARIFARAVPSPYEAPGRLAVGWIAGAGLGVED